MHLEGSCHCGSVKFSVESAQPVPFMRCYCSICRKTAGGGGFAINLGAQAATFKLLKGKRQLRIYRAQTDHDGKPHESTGERHFCSRCGSALWLFDPTWPELIHPHAGAIDTPLPIAPSHVHMMLGSMASWVPLERHRGDSEFAAYPDLSLAEWHQSHGFTA